MQMFLIYITFNEFFFASCFDPAPRKLMAIIFALLIISLFLSLFLTWRILHFAERKAATTAQEKLAEEIRQEIDALRGQRHDFITHVQIMMALLSEGRKEELAMYVEALNNFAEAYRVVSEFMMFYNNIRIHSGIHYLTPVEYYEEAKEIL